MFETTYKNANFAHNQTTITLKQAFQFSFSYVPEVIYIL